MNVCEGHIWTDFVPGKISAFKVFEIMQNLSQFSRMFLNEQIYKLYFIFIYKIGLMW